MRRFVTLAKDWTYTAIGGTYTKKAGQRFHIDGTNNYIDKNGDVILLHWYGYGQAAKIEKEYFKNTA